MKNELEKLNEIKDAIKIEEEKLKNIYWIKDSSISLHNFLLEINYKKQELKKEQEEILKNRKRDDEEYNYNLIQARKKSEDEYLQKQNTLKNMFDEDIKIRKDEIEKDELELKNSLGELKELKLFKENFEKNKNDAIKFELDNQKKELNRDFDVKFNIENQKNTSEINLLKQEILNLKNLLKNKDDNLSELKIEALNAKQKA